MEITPLGYDAFRIQGKQLDLVINPFDGAKTGLKMPKIEPNLILLSSDEPHRADVTHSAEQIVIDRAGEYEVRGSIIEGIDVGEGVTAYLIRLEGLTIGYLGEISDDVKNDQLGAVTDADILFLPVGTERLSPKKAAALAGNLEPKIVIPTHFAATGLKLSAESPATFLNEMGVKPKPEQRFRVTTKDLPEEPTVVLLEP